MFRSGELVVYGIHGVCRILGLVNKRIDRKSIEYYELEPIDQSGSRYYVPSQNAAAVSKMKPLLTDEELDALLKSECSQNEAWIADENQRKQLYRELITSGNRAELIRMVHALHKHKNEQLTAGRKFHLCDDNFLRDAEKLLNTEFSLVLNIPESEVGAYVQKAISEE